MMMKYRREDISNILHSNNPPNIIQKGAIINKLIVIKYNPNVFILIMFSSRIGYNPITMLFI